MSSEIENIYSEYNRTKVHQFHNYNAKAHTPMLNEVLGYVADVNDLSRLTNSYNVVVPEMNNVMLRAVPRKIPGAFTQANGVGYSPPPLRPGQPVTIRFINNRTSLPVIDGAPFINGLLEAWEKEDYPAIDKKDSKTKLALFPTPLPPEALAVKNDAEVKVYPLILRTSSPTQPSNSGTALEVPGTTYVTDSQGNVFTYFAGERIVVGKNETKSVEGARQSMADMPNQQAIKKAQRLQAEMVESMTNWRIALAGEFQLGSVHPASNRKRNGAFSLDSSSQGLSGSLSIDTGIKISELPGSSYLKGTLDKVTEISDLLDFASKVSGQQLNFLQKTILPILKKLTTLWGSFGKFGMLSVSFQIDLPLNLKVSISVKFNATTGKLSINIGVGFGVGTVINGSQPLSLSSENPIIAGGIERSVNPQIVVRTEVTNYEESTIYDTFLELSGFAPLTLDSNTVPYELVSRELNDLNFSERPEDALASLLVKTGVKSADQVIKYLLALIQYGSAFDFLKLAAVLGTPYQQLIILTGVGDLGGLKQEESNQTQISNEITTILNTVTKPAVLQCPTLPDETYQVFYKLQRGEVEVAARFIQEFFGEESPIFSTWVEDLSNFLEWAREVQHPFYPALFQLKDGNVINFLLLLIYLNIGADLRAYPDAYSELQGYVKVAFPMPRLGVEE